MTTPTRNGARDGHVATESAVAVPTMTAAIAPLVSASGEIVRRRLPSVAQRTPARARASGLLLRVTSRSLAVSSSTFLPAPPSAATVGGVYGWRAAGHITPARRVPPVAASGTACYDPPPAEDPWCSGPTCQPVTL